MSQTQLITSGVLKWRERERDRRKICLSSEPDLVVSMLTTDYDCPFLWDGSEQTTVRRELRHEREREIGKH